MRVCVSCSRYGGSDSLRVRSTERGVRGFQINNSPFSVPRTPLSELLSPNSSLPKPNPFFQSPLVVNYWERFINHLSTPNHEARHPQSPAVCAEIICSCCLARCCTGHPLLWQPFYLPQRTGQLWCHWLQWHGVL